MGASDDLLIQMVFSGCVVCLAMLAVCIIVNEIRKSIVKQYGGRAQRKGQSVYRIHLSNRQMDKEYEMTFQKEIVVGRSVEPAKLVLSNDRSVSKNHFKITADHGRFMIEDLNSANHTWLNGKQVTTKVPIKTGDRVVAGYYSYLVKLEEDVEA